MDFLKEVTSHNILKTSKVILKAYLSNSQINFSK